MSNEYNPSFFCPIKAEIMVDPVIDREGNSYERKEIEEWIKLHQTSPITRNPLYLTDLTPNRALQAAIEEAFAQNKEKNTIATSESPKKLNMTIEGDNNPNMSLIIRKEVSPIDMESTNQIVDVNISALHNQEKERVPSNIVVAIDVSGSMGISASIPGLEDCNLSILDVVKHAVKTIIHTLGPQDKLAIIKFSDVASLILNFTLMTESGKRTAEQMLTNLQPDGMTNIWDALSKSMNMLKDNMNNNTSIHKNSSIILLTDGEPNINPPRGIIPMLERYADLNGGKYPGIINTFGFGYSLDSKLLYQIASMGGGMYAFIPDSGFVGTAFVHALANTLVTIADDTTIEIVPSTANGVKLLSKRSVRLGSIQAGQTKDIIAKFSIPADYNGPLFRGVISYYPFQNSVKSKKSFEVLYAISQSDEDEILSDMTVLASHKFRIKLTEVLSKILSIDIKLCAELQISKVRSEAIALAEDINSWIITNKDNVEHLQPDAVKRIVGILADIEGEVYKALSNMEWFTKWGYHYLLSLKRSHELQQCNNFKDPGIQYYGGKMFKDVRDFADDKFCQLPPPTASLRDNISDSVSNRSQSSSYHNSMKGQKGNSNVHLINNDNFDSDDSSSNSNKSIFNLNFMRGNKQNNVVRSTPKNMTTFSMSSFNCRDAPCFHESCIVYLSNGLTKSLPLVKRGDKLLDNSIVECVLRTKCKDGEIDMVCFKDSGLIITPWHPIEYENDWKFPNDLSHGILETVKCEYVYSYLVRKSNQNNTIFYNDNIIINGIKCLTLGHNIKNHFVASHPFFGTNKIVNRLKSCKGWISGQITLDQNQGNCIKRDIKTGLVCDIIEHFHEVNKLVKFD